MKRFLNVSDKPYNKCFACQHLKTPRCNGPRTASMELLRWCEYMRDLRDLFGLTNEYIAEKADVSLKTINKIMSCKADQDIYRDTARRIENVILGENGGAACYLAFEEEHSPENQKLSSALLELERALKDNDEYRAALDNIHNSYNTELAIIRDESQRKIQFLLAQIDSMRKDMELMRRDMEYLRNENDRKSRIIDNYLTEHLGLPKQPAQQSE